MERYEKTPPSHSEAQIDEIFVPKFAERIKLWLETIELSGVSQKAKNEFKKLILNSSYLQSANDDFKEGKTIAVPWGLKLRDFISGLLGLSCDLKRKKEGEADELDAIFQNLRDDIWDFWQENKKTED